jgi:hypothetical protein
MMATTFARLFDEAWSPAISVVVSTIKARQDLANKTLQIFNSSLKPVLQLQASAKKATRPNTAVRDEPAGRG